MNELKYLLKENEFSNVIKKGTGLPQIDTIRDTLMLIDLDGLEVILSHTVKKAIQNKVFRDGTILFYFHTLITKNRKKLESFSVTSITLSPFISVSFLSLKT